MPLQPEFSEEIARNLGAIGFVRHHSPERLGPQLWLNIGRYIYFITIETHALVANPRGSRSLQGAIRVRRKLPC